MMGLITISKSFYELIMQKECSILSNEFKITIEGLTFVAGNQFFIFSGSSNYGLYTIVSVSGNTYTTSTRMPALKGNYTIIPVPASIPDP